MRPSKDLQTMDVYASESQYVTGPTDEQQAKGTIPLDTLPADWWNWLWKEITTRINSAATDVQTLYQEVLSVLTQANITPSALQTDQLLKAIQSIARTTGTSSIAGAVKSSTDSGKIAIDDSGYMSPNGMGIPTSLNTTAKTIVSAVNEVLATLNDYKTTNNAAVTAVSSALDSYKTTTNTSLAGKAPINHAYKDTTYGKASSAEYGHVTLSDSTDSNWDTTRGCAATPNAVRQVANSKAPTNHASTDTTYGVGTSTNYGHVKLSDSTSTTSSTTEGVAATPSAVKAVQDAVDILEENLKIPTGVVVPYAGATAPAEWLLCDGSIYTSEAYPDLFAVIGRKYTEDTILPDGQFRVPDLRECTPVGPGKRTYGDITNHLNLALGEFQDDQIASHTHSVTAKGTISGGTYSFTGTSVTSGTSSILNTGSESSHTHTVGAHSHGLNSHTHSFTPSGTITTTELIGYPGCIISGRGRDADTPRGIFSQGGYNGQSYEGYHDYDGGDWAGKYVKLDASHNHTFTGSAKNTGTPSTTNTANSTAFTSGAGSSHSHSMSHTHSVTASGSVSVSTNPTFTGSSVTSGSTGTATGGTHGKLLGMNYIIKT